MSRVLLLSRRFRHRDHRVLFGLALGLSIAWTGCANPAAPEVLAVVVAPDRITSENLDTAEISVRLEVEPTAPVTFAVSSDDTDEGTVAPAELVFTPQNWDVEQIITVTGVEDGIGPSTDDGFEEYKIEFEPAESSDPVFDRFRVSDIEMTNLDNDVTFVIRDKETQTLISEWPIAENGAPLVLEVELGAKDRPAADVMFDFSLSFDGGPVATPDDANVSFAASDPQDTATLTFTPGNYAEVQELTIYPRVDDGNADPGKVFDLDLTIRGDASFVAVEQPLRALSVIPYKVQNVDPDSTEVIVSPASPQLCLGAVLDGVITLSKPGDATVNLDLASSAAFTLNPSQLVFSDGGPSSLPFKISAPTRASQKRGHALELNVEASTLPYSAIAPAPQSIQILLVDGIASDEEEPLPTAVIQCAIMDMDLPL